MRFRRFLPVALLGAAVYLWAPLAPAHAAAKAGGGAKSSTTPPPSAMAMTAQTIVTNPNTPPWCLTEDDFDQRTYQGSLSGSYSMTEQLCNDSSDYYNGIWWTSGGIGLESDISVVGQLIDLTITAPDGTVHHAVLMGQTSSRGTTTSHYAVCFVPPYYSSNDIGAAPLNGGTYQITVSGSISSSTWQTNAQMTDVNYQQSYCPASERNLK
jgi:hypothetical protein